MRRSLPFRSGVALLAAWFVALVVHSAWMPPMAMDGMHGAQSADLAAHNGMAGMTGMAGHGPSPTNHHRPTDCSQHECCCITVVVLAPPRAELAWVPVRIVRPGAVAPVERVEPSRGEHVIPFAIGPPDTLAG